MNLLSILPVKYWYLGVINNIIAQTHITIEQIGIYPHLLNDNIGLKPGSRCLFVLSILVHRIPHLAGVDGNAGVINFQLLNNTV